MLRSKQNPRELVPLQRVSVEATIRSFAADVSITQVFRNNESTPIEAVYCFPIEEQAAIYRFVARIDDREIIAQLKEKKAAQKEYTEALQRGHGAYLLEQDEKSQDNFIINVGALHPGKKCTIVISYVTELELVENGTKIRFVVPTTIAPRYNPSSRRVTSPSGSTSKYVQSSPYTIEFRCQVEKFGVASISSSSHPVKVALNQQDLYVVTFARENTQLDRDILLDLELDNNRPNTILAIERGAIMAAFTPNEEDCQEAMHSTEMINEFIFVVDCSGSMEAENKIGLARKALLLFLKSLPTNCQFNIIRFGSSHEALFTDITVRYDERNARKAEQLSKNMRADLGGTELLEVLQWLETNPPDQGRARQIFLLTDGEISNVGEVLELCQTMATSTRIFSFGLGDSPSRSLVKGLARATNGRFVFIPPNTSVDVHVGEQLRKALQPCITNLQVHWELGTGAITSVPTKTPPVYANDRLIVYALADRQSTAFRHDARVQLITGRSRIGKATVTSIPTVASNESIARLAAKALILELQHAKLPSSTQTTTTGSRQGRFGEHSKPKSMNDDEAAKGEVKRRIIDLSLMYNILSPHTAFVGVEKRVNSSNANMVLREVPIQISTDDQHRMSPTQQLYSNTSYSAGSADENDRDNSPPPPTRGALRSPSLCNYAQYSPPMPRSRESHRSTYPRTSNRHASRSPSPPASGMMRTYSSSDEELKYFDGNSPRVDVRGFSKNSRDAWPANDEDVVRHLIEMQHFDGSWSFTTDDIQRLTGKPLADFQRASRDDQVLISAIVIAVLETRFASFSSLWHGVVQKARRRLVDLLGKNIKTLDALLTAVRKLL